MLLQGICSIPDVNVQREIMICNTGYTPTQHGKVWLTFVVGEVPTPTEPKSLHFMFLLEHMQSDGALCDSSF